MKNKSDNDLIVEMISLQKKHTQQGSALTRKDRKRMIALRGEANRRGFELEQACVDARWLASRQHATNEITKMRKEQEKMSLLSRFSTKCSKIDAMRELKTFLLGQKINGKVAAYIFHRVESVRRMKKEAGINTSFQNEFSVQYMSYLFSNSRANDKCPCGSGKRFKKCHKTSGRV